MIKKLTYNFSPTAADCLTVEVGVDGVKSITENRARGDGDKWFYDVDYEDERISLRIFHPCTVESEFPPKKQ